MGDVSEGVTNAGVAHYMPIAELPADKARDLVHVKVVAPTMLVRAGVPGMVARDEGTIINVAGMIAFSGPDPQVWLPRRAVYAGALAHLVAITQVLHEEASGAGPQRGVPNVGRGHGYRQLARPGAG
jgi:uncharacterized protein